MDRKEAVGSEACSCLIALGRAFCTAVLSLGFNSNWIVHPALGTVYAGAKDWSLGRPALGSQEGCLLIGVSAAPVHKSELPFLPTQSLWVCFT